MSIAVTKTGHIELWTMNLPESRNPISSAEMINAFVDHTNRVNEDKSIRAVILTGAGTAFSAGGNVKDMSDRAGMFAGSPYEMRDGYRFGIQRITTAVFGCEVPLIAAVNGPAVGAGCDLAAMCDLRIAATTAWFAEGFVKLGVIPGDGGAWLLSKLIGPARAAELALTGDRISAETAEQWGLVNSVVAPEELLDAAYELAERIAANPPHAVRMAKRLLRESQQLPLSSLLDMSASMQALAHHTADHREALDAFEQRRHGEYQGK